MEAIGVAMFDRLDAAAIMRPAPVMALRGLEADVLEQKTPTRASGDVPSPLASVIGSALDDISWKRVSPGVAQHVIKLPSTNRGELRLVKVSPGQALPEHAHNGSELTLILRGSYRDSTGHYQVGDVADMCSDAAHSPIADPVEGCICLVATDGKLKFKSVVARLVQPFTGF